MRCTPIASRPGPRDQSEIASTAISPKILAGTDPAVLKGAAFSLFDLLVLVEFWKGRARFCGG